MKTRQATTQATLFLIWLIFWVVLEKGSQHRMRKEMFIFEQNIVKLNSC